MSRERRFELLYGSELKGLIKEKPLAWVPLGILEKHGEHLPWGLDATKAHRVCLCLANKLGGVVLPPNHFAGVHEPWHEDSAQSRMLQAKVGDFYLRPVTFRMFLLDLLDGLALIGFRKVVLYSGHYPRLQRQLLGRISKKASRKLRIDVIPFTELDFFGEGDHAGKWETSIYLALDGTVKLDALRASQKGKLGFWHGDSPRQATKEFGAHNLKKILRYFEEIV